MAPVASGCCTVLAWRKGSRSAHFTPRLDPGPRRGNSPSSQAGVLPLAKQGGSFRADDFKRGRRGQTVTLKMPLKDPQYPAASLAHLHVIHEETGIQ